MLGGRKGGSTAGKGGEKKTMEVDEEVDLNAVDDEVDLNYSARSLMVSDCTHRAFTFREQQKLLLEGEEDSMDHRCCLSVQ